MSCKRAILRGTGRGDKKETRRDQRQNEGSDSQGSSAIPSKNLHANVTQKKPQRELIYSENKESNITAMCFISESRLCVMSTSKEEFLDELKLFDAAGQLLKTVDTKWSCWGLIPIADSIALSWWYDKNTVQLIRHDGRITTHDLEIKVENLVSSAAKDYQYLKAINDSKLSRVKFECAENSQSDSLELLVGESHRESAGKLQLTWREEEVVFDEMPPGKLVDVCAGGDCFAFVAIDGESFGTVTVYTKSETRSFDSLCSYTTLYHISDVCFWNVGGKDLLLVAVESEDKIYVFNYKVAGNSEPQPDIASLKLHRPGRLLTGHDQQLYIGCYGGKIVVVDPKFL